MSTVAEAQVAAVRALCERQKSMSMITFDAGILVSVGEVEGAIAEAEQQWRDEQTCPECVQGKHENCTEDLLIDDLDYVDCICREEGHGREASVARAGDLP